MLIQNISGTAPALSSVLGGNGASVAAPTTQAAPAELPQVAVKQTAQPTPDQLKKAVDSINSAMQKSNPEVQFSIDPSTKQTVIKVTDSQTGQLITQFPSQGALAISQMIEQEQSGALIRQKA